VSTITAILEPDADGSLHLPLPADFPRGKVKVTAVIEAIGAEKKVRARRELTPAEEADLRAKAIAAFQRLHAQNPFRDIEDPVGWQREIRQDRPIAGRG
jgi:hypothetical protein